MFVTPKRAVIAAALARGLQKVKSFFGKPNPTKTGAGGKQQPYDKDTGRYLPKDSNPGFLHSQAGRFTSGFAQGFAEAVGSGAQGATPVGAAGEFGHLTGTITGTIASPFL